MELVTFCLEGRDFAVPLAGVREVVRLAELAKLPGMAPPLAGVLELRGSALPVLDVRAQPAERGDVLVLAGDGDAVGFAVDRVTAVLPAGALAEAPGGTDAGLLPAYVDGVLRGARGPVFLVDVRRMVAASAAA